MKKVAVVYWSGTGNTEAMAKAVVEGAKQAGAEVDLMTSAEFGPDKVEAYDAIAFGCPSMGDEVLEETEFQPMWDSVQDSLGSKTVSLFGSYGWGDGQWMRTWEAEAPCDISETYICNETPGAEEEDECRGLGARLAQ